MLLAFTALVNFQPAGASIPSGYIADTGAEYGARNGFTYGWETLPFGINGGSYFARLNFHL